MSNEPIYHYRQPCTQIVVGSRYEGYLPSRQYTDREIAVLDKHQLEILLGKAAAEESTRSPQGEPLRATKNAQEFAQALVAYGDFQKTPFEFPLLPSEEQLENDIRPALEKADCPICTHVSWRSLFPID